MTTYKEAGVDVELKARLTERLKELVASTFTAASISTKTAFKFGGGISLRALKGYDDPVLVTSTDGVGTKMMVAGVMKKWDTVGEDIVNHCANDVFTAGAKPLFFLDYVAAEKLEPDVIEGIVKGVARACRKLGVVLAGGETAEMPGVYAKGQHDLAGTMGGIVERKSMVTGERIVTGDVLLGIASSGLHTNGYSLARRILLGGRHAAAEKELGMSAGDALLAPHREYVTLLSPVVDTGLVKGLAHITGGGLTDNIPRILGNGIGVEIVKGSWDVPRLFRLIEGEGNVPEADMFRTFNMGIGMVVVVDREDAEGIVQQLSRKEKVFTIGRVVRGKGVAYVDS